jgi:hypothetical protein
VTILQGLALCTTLLAAALAHADADGPDYYDVAHVRAGSSLRLRAQPDAGAAILARIPADGTCLANRGCVGGPTFEEFTTLPEAQRREIERARPRWCKVVYRGSEGFVAGRYLRESRRACGVGAR